MADRRRVGPGHLAQPGCPRRPAPCDGGTRVARPLPGFRRWRPPRWQKRSECPRTTFCSPTAEPKRSHSSAPRSGSGWVDEPEFSLYRRHLGLVAEGVPVRRFNPHNPTGRLAAPDERAAVWDEAFYALATGCWTRGDAQSGAVVIGSLTKLFACPGLRLGYVLERGRRPAAAAGRPPASMGGRVGGARGRALPSRCGGPRRLVEAGRRPSRRSRLGSSRAMDFIPILPTPISCSSTPPGDCETALPAAGSSSATAPASACRTPFASPYPAGGLGAPRPGTGWRLGSRRTGEKRRPVATHDHRIDARRAIERRRAAGIAPRVRHRQRRRQEPDRDGPVPPARPPWPQRGPLQGSEHVPELVRDAVRPRNRSRPRYSSDRRRRGSGGDDEPDPPEADGRAAKSSCRDGPAAGEADAAAYQSLKRDVLFPVVLDAYDDLRPA